MIPTLSHLPEVPSTAASLGDWLAWLETIHPVSIDMGLERVSLVADRLQLRSPGMPLILVAGTNGKGSTVGMLATIYRLAGFRVGAYTSPHISDFRERIRVDGEMASARAIIDALAFVEAGRRPQTLTYFEYTTLAAMKVFIEAGCDVCVLEVGLGGRLDATNLWDADCAIVTSIALDHADYLGTDLSVIATEKAAIGRPGKPLVVGQPSPPASIEALAAERGMLLQSVGDQAVDALPMCNLPGEHQRRNAACALAAVEALQTRLPVAAAVCEQALQQVNMTARFEQREHAGVHVILDVAHNPAGADSLRETWLQQIGPFRAPVIFAALSDKDVAGIAEALEPVVSQWHCVPLQVPRALSAEALQQALDGRTGAGSGTAPTSCHETLEAGWQQALADARTHGGYLLVAGSFHTVALVQALLESAERSHSD